MGEVAVAVLNRRADAEALLDALRASHPVTMPAKLADHDILADLPLFMRH
jgi:hypothetical protein